MSHSTLVHKFIPTPQAMKIPDAKAAVDKERKKARDNSSMELAKIQSKKEVFSGSTKRQKQVSCRVTDGSLSPQKIRSQNPIYRSTKGRVVLRGDVVKDDSGA